MKTNEAKFKFQMIKATDVYNILSKLKNGKATEMHLIPNKILKSVKEIIANSLSDVFNASILTKIFPDDFKIARVTPIFKGGEAEDIENYRPFSILASVARILRSYFINNCMTSFQRMRYLILSNGAFGHCNPLLWLLLTALQIG